MGIKLDVGGGRNPLPGYKTLDIVQLGKTDYVCPAWSTPLADGSVEALYARHFLEHLTLAEAKKTLKEWHRIMAPGAVAAVTVPDLAYHARQLFATGSSEFVKGRSNFDHAIAGFYGWQEQGEEMGHRYGYTPGTLCALFAASDFETSMEPSRKCDIVLRAWRLS
jgi:hypothetical protein